MMNKINYPILLITIIFFSSCIGDDFLLDEVEETLRITTNIDTLELGTEILLESMFLNNIGKEEEVDVNWTSSDPSIISVNQNGLVIALSEGQTTIRANYESLDVDLSDAITITVGNSTVISNQSKNGNVRTTSSYLLEGSFEMTETSAGVKLMLGSDYRASSSLPGLYVYLSNNRNSISDALEIGKVAVFSGAHEYNIQGVGLNDFSHIVYFCKPFNVKVGEAEL